MAGSQTATILVTDLVGSTELRVRLGEDRANALRRLHDDTIRAAVEGAAGTVVKGLGDGVLAMFSGAADAVGAAVLIQQAAYAHSRRFPEQALEMRAGLSSGDVVVEDGDCFGTPVVEASRLCRAAVAGQILAAEVVRVLARGRGGHSFTSAGERELKGLPDPVPVVVVGWDPPPVADMGVAFPDRLASAGSAPLCGRDPELHAIVDEWKRALSGHPRLVLIAGEPGIGKTRLAGEFARGAYDDGAVVLFGRSDEDLGMPFQPFVEALENVVRAGPRAESLGRHPGELARLVPDIGDAIDGLPPPLSSDPQTERYRLFDAVASWLQAAGEHAGVILVLDDLHWADKPTLLLLRHLARSVDPIRLLVVGTYRDTDLDRAHPLSEVLADLRRESSVQRMSLSGLDPDAIAELLARLSGGRTDGREDELARVLWSETEGNPFFLVEILANLVESGRLVQRDGVWTSDLEIDQLAIPEGIREVVGRRLSRLSETTNAVLSLASVVGATFDVGPLVTLSDLSEDVVIDALEHATTAALVKEVGGGTYEFTHALVRSTLYEEQSAARRSRRHRQLAEVLEKTTADPATLAYHFARAGQADERAIRFAVAAGQAALAQLAFDQAAAFFAQALEAGEDLGVDDRTRCGLLIHLGGAQRLAGGTAYRETLLRAAALARHLGDAGMLAEAALANSRGFFSAGPFVDAERVEVLDAALGELEPGDSVTRARLMSVLAAELMFGDPTGRRRDMANDALSMARRLGDERCLVDVWTLQLMSAGHPATTEEMLAEHPALMELAERAGNAQQIVVAAMIGYVKYLEVGDFSSADVLLGRLDDEATESNNPFFRWLASYCRCTRLMVAASGDEIEHAAHIAFDRGEEAGQPDVFVTFATQFAISRLHQGRIAEIIDLVARQAAENPHVPAWRAALAANLARLRRDEEARAALDDLAGRFDGMPDDLLWLVGESFLAEAISRVGTAEEAERQYLVLLPYAGRFPTVGAMIHRSVTLDLATLAARAGRAADAEGHFADAASMHERAGAVNWLAETNLKWGLFLLAGGDAAGAKGRLALALEEATATSCADVAFAASEALATLS